MTSLSCRRIVALAWVVCALASSGVLAAGSTAAAAPAALPTPTVVAADPGRQPLVTGIVTLEDPSGKLDLTAVRARPAADWKSETRPPVSIGYSRSTWWLHLRLRNDGATPLERLFEMGSALQDYIDLSVVRGDGRVERFATLGDRVPFSNRPVQSVNPTVPLTIEPHETLDLYLRLSTHDGLYEHLPLTLWAKQDFARDEEWHWFCTGLFCGLFGLLLVYNAFLYLGTRNLNFAFYIGYLLATLVWRMTFSGDGLYLLWPEHPVFNNQILPLAVGAWFAAGALFVTHHLQMRRYLPGANVIMLSFAAASALVAMLALFGFYALPFILFVPLGLLLPIGIRHCVRLMRRGHRRAIWVAISWAPLFSCGALYLLQLVGAPGMDRIPPLSTSLQFALAAQMLLLGGGLADDTNRWRQSMLAAERAARERQEGLAATLESEVQQRTLALEQANEQLRALTITDALTGVYNRRHFNESLETELARLQRQGEMPALCLLDVDHFKAYNDRYGHQKGDLALKAIATELKRRLRRAGDKVFRVGGEEFALLLMPGDLETQGQHVEALRAAIEALQIPHLGNPAFGVITASFGLVQMPPSGEGSGSPTASMLYREADRLLYMAKASGRNRVVSDQRPQQTWAQSTDFMSDGTPPAPT